MFLGWLFHTKFYTQLLVFIAFGKLISRLAYVHKRMIAWWVCLRLWFLPAQCYASAVLAVGLCLCPSVRSRSSTKTAKRRITQTIPHDNPGTLVFWCQRSPQNSTGVTPYKGAECRWGGQNRRLSTNSRLYLENVKDRHIDSIKVE